MHRYFSASKESLLRSAGHRIDEAKELLLDDFTADELNELIEIYSNAYGGILSAEEAFEEICCDALGRMNIFEGTDLNSESYGKAQDTVRKYAAERSGSKGRAPPKKGGEMYSREVNGKKIAWIENNPLSLKDLTNYKKVAAYIANHIGEAHTILESGNKVYIGESLPNEYTQSEYTKSLLKNNQPVLRAKKKAIGSFGEMIEIATNRRWERAKHAENKDAKYGIYRYSTAFAFPVKQNNKITNVKSFDAELVILNSSDGKKYLSDIVNIKENTADETDLLKKDQRRQDAATRRGASENSIRSSSENVNEKFSREVKSAEEYFGTTYKVKEAGYICTDGKMLDFSGRHEGAPGGYRTVDHRDITDALGEDYGGEDYSGGMIKFMSEGNIRVSPESGGINLSVAPNKAQRSTLDRYISSFRGEVILDIDQTNGDTIASVEYPKYTHSSVVFKDIDDYFDKGKMPEKFSREPQIHKNVKVGKQTWAQIQNRRMLKYGNEFDTMPSMDYIFANDSLFVINNYDETSFAVTRKIDPANDKVLADIIVEALKNGSITNTREYNSIAKMLRNNARRGNGDNVHVRNGRTAGDNARLDDKSERAANRGSATDKGSGDNGVSYSREPERLNELRRQNERKLAQATAEDAANENERGLDLKAALVFLRLCRDRRFGVVRRRTLHAYLQQKRSYKGRHYDHKDYSREHSSGYEPRHAALLRNYQRNLAARYHT